MKVHHINTGTMCPMGGRLVTGRGGLLRRARMVCHVLVAESADGLVLVDTGLGTGDIASPERLGRWWLRQASPRLDPAETALAQVQALGYSPRDVRHIVVTHLDLDHAGGLSDFPDATVHVHRREHEAAMAAGGPRYVGAQWAHEPRWALHEGGGEDWFGFSGVRALGDREPDILLIPLPGHSAGHSGVAVRGERGWLLHAGDAYFFHGQIQTPPARAPLGLAFFQRRIDADRAARIDNQERLRRLAAEHGDEIAIFNGHDAVDFDRATARAAGAAEARGSRSAASPA